MQGKSSKAEVKDLVVKGKKGKRGPADAQTGNVPMPQFKTLVKDYTGESYDFNIPQVGSKLDSKYWSKYLDYHLRSFSFSRCSKAVETLALFWTLKLLHCP